jgi:acyl dehydratase
MSVDLQAVGFETTPFTLRYDWKNLVLYALGIGAKRGELDYVYEARGPKVFPTFAVVPAYPVLGELLARAGGSLERLVHGSQSVRMLAPIPPAGELTTIGKIAGLYDLKRMAQLVFTTQTTCEGRLVFESEWSMLLLGEGGFGGARPPKSPIPKVLPSGTPRLFVFEEQISPEQALLYRLSGDFNPLHVDPEFARLVGFEQGPILHGLASYGFCARALIHSVLGGNAARLSVFHAQFRKPVWPGEIIRTEGFEVEGKYILRASAGGRDEPAVLCAAEVIPG